MTASNVEVGNVQPQTTAEPGPGPFIQHTQPGSAPQYIQSSINIGQSWQVASPLTSVPGYIRKWRLKFTASGGVNGTETVAITADAPYNIVQNVLVQDGFGNQIITGGGYDVLYLIPKYGSQFGLGSAREISNLPSYSPVSVGSSGTGDFVFSSVLPLEFAKGIGTIGGANASIQPKIILTGAPSSSVYSTAPGTLPTLAVNVNTDFYWLPQASNVVPPGEGTSEQWISQPANPTIGTGLAQPVTIPRAGGYVSTLLFVLRDSTGARIDAWPDPIKIIVDGVPWVNEPFSQLEDDMYIQFQGQTRETGVIAVSRKDSLSQEDLGLLDTGMSLLSTQPGTSIQIEGTWGTISNSPATLTCYLGTVVPNGSLVTGLVEA